MLCCPSRVQPVLTYENKVRCSYEARQIKNTAYALALSGKNGEFFSHSSPIEEQNNGVVNCFLNITMEQIIVGFG